MLLGIGTIYFNATIFPGGIYLGCNGNGNAGDGAGAPYRVCPGEDFWLPEMVKESTYGKAGTWQPPYKEDLVLRDSGTPYLEPVTKASNYYRINWSLGDEDFYKEDHTSFTTPTNRENFYVYTQYHCIKLCEEAVSTGHWSGDCSYDYLEQNEIGFPNISESEIKPLFDWVNLGGEDTWFYSFYYEGEEIKLQTYRANGTRLEGTHQRYCNPAFKEDAYFKKHSIKLMISLGEGKVMNGQIPASCKEEFGISTLYEMLDVSYSVGIDSLEDNVNESDDTENYEEQMLGLLKEEPDWSNKTAIEECVKKHYTNIFKSIDTFGMRDQIYSINFTHEGGVLWNFYKLAEDNFPTITERDDWQENWISAVALAIDDYVDSDTSVTDKASRKLEWKNKFYVNFYHGRAFKATVARALKNGMGIGEHSLQTAHAYSYLQHLPHLTYNQSNMRYDINLDNTPSILHTDVESIHMAHLDLIGLERKYLNTWGTYRRYRNSVLKEIAYGYNSMTNTGALIPSRGLFDHYTDCQTNTGGLIQHWDGSGPLLENCNWDNDDVDSDNIDGDGADALYDWTRKMIARPAQDSPEAYCLFSQNGNRVPDVPDAPDRPEVPVNEDFLYLDALNKSTWHWGQLHSSTTYKYSFIEVPYTYAATSETPPTPLYFTHVNHYQNFMYAPLIKSTGMHCKTVQLPKSAFGYKTDLPGGRMLNEEFIGLTNPTFNNQVYVGFPQQDPVNYPDKYFYEATRLNDTLSINATSVNKAAIVLDFDDSFVGTKLNQDNWVLKLTLSVAKEFCEKKNPTESKASFLLRYRNSSNRLVEKKIVVDKSKLDFCENKTYVMSVEWNSRGYQDRNNDPSEIKITTSLKPRVFTVTVPFHSFEKSNNIDLTKEVATYGSKSIPGLNDNLVIEQDRASEIDLDVLSVRLIKNDFDDNGPVGRTFPAEDPSESPYSVLELEKL